MHIRMVCQLGLQHTFKLAKNILLSVRQGPNQGDEYSFLFVTNLLESKTELALIKADFYENNEQAQTEKPTSPLY